VGESTGRLYGGRLSARVRRARLLARGMLTSAPSIEPCDPWKRIKSAPRSPRSRSAASLCGGTFDFDAKRERLEEVNRELEDPNVWSDSERAQNLGRERAELETVVGTLSRIDKSLGEAEELHELASEEDDSALLSDLIGQVDGVAAEVARLEFRRMFSGKMDAHNAFLDIQAGSGGTEAQDWAAMLFRMYLRWGEKHGFAVDVLDESPGEVAGLKSASLHFKGEYAFGWLRTETGVHRLVRKSPFDSGHRRHTSFAAVFVAPEIEDDIEIELNPSDLRVDVFRSSGAGGQHVNKTESAIRITHIPTGIVVQCQNERSQHKNRATAMNQMRAKLYELEEQKRKEQAQIVEDNKADIGWGNQIRSYVLDQSRVKDLRTNLESGRPQNVLDGDLDDFLQESLKQGL
jgi:peptide chain release factor 2